jgi:hypothetical protein
LTEYPNWRGALDELIAHVNQVLGDYERAPGSASRDVTSRCAALEARVAALEKIIRQGMSTDLGNGNWHFPGLFVDKRG